MGLFDRLFGRPPAVKNIGGGEYFQALTGYTPRFTTWGGRIYESELVRAAIDAKARHISKLHVHVNGTAKPRLHTNVRSGPNDWQTWGQFLYRLATVLEMQNTAFIVPVIDMYGDVAGYYPVLPSQCEVLQYKGDAWLRYHFQNGKTAAMEMASCGVMTKYQYENDFFGDSNNALNGTMSLIDMQNQGITEAIKNSASYRFMAKVSNFTKPEDLAKERQRFSRENLQSEGGGILLFPNTYSEIKQMEAKPYVVDANQMQLIKMNVFNYFGVNEDILQNKCTGDAWSAFYEGAIEPFAVQCSDVMSRMTFTDRERANGNEILLTANRLQAMTNNDKLQYITQLIDRGIINRDEGRAILNMPPLPDGLGQKYEKQAQYIGLNENDNEGSEQDADEPGERVPSNAGNADSAE